jgi:hypothetical protein
MFSFKSFFQSILKMTKKSCCSKWAFYLAHRWRCSTENKIIETKNNFLCCSWQKSKYWRVAAVNLQTGFGDLCKLSGSRVGVGPLHPHLPRQGWAVRICNFNELNLKLGQHYRYVFHPGIYRNCRFSLGLILKGYR